VPSLARESAVSLPIMPACPRIHVRLTEWQVEASLSSDCLVLIQSKLEDDSRDRALTEDRESVKMATEEPCEGRDSSTSSSNVACF
jgi:hypothetical protein